MKKLTQLNDCPNCQNELQVRVLECGECGLKLEGAFARDPLLALTGEDLHFVRLFLHCEGSIRDMEKALGVSYPTVKARLAQIKTRLNAGSEAPKKPLSVLEKLEAGQLDYNEALRALKGEDNA